MIDKSTLLDTPEARAEAYDKIAEYGGTMSDVQIVHEMSGIDEGIRKYRATLKDEDTRLAEAHATTVPQSLNCGIHANHKSTFEDPHS